MGQSEIRKGKENKSACDCKSYDKQSNKEIKNLS